MKKYPTLKEVFLPEISREISDKYVSKLKTRRRKKLFKQLSRLSKIVIKLYKDDVPPSKAAELLKTFISLNPEINPLKYFDTLGVKMFIHNQDKDSIEIGKEKRYYENIIQAYLKDYL